ncbi:hypothetical protein [Moorena producens]
MLATVFDWLIQYDIKYSRVSYQWSVTDYSLPITHFTQLFH